MSDERVNCLICTKPMPLTLVNGSRAHPKCIKKTRHEFAKMLAEKFPHILWFKGHGDDEYRVSAASTELAVHSCDPHTSLKYKRDIVLHFLPSWWSNLKSEYWWMGPLAPKGSTQMAIAISRVVPSSREFVTAGGNWKRGGHWKYDQTLTVSTLEYPMEPVVVVDLADPGWLKKAEDAVCLVFPTVLECLDLRMKKSRMGRGSVCNSCPQQLSCLAQNSKSRR